MRRLLALTAAIEVVAGLALLLSPPLFVALVIGAALDAPAALIVGRVTGIAILALTLACWLARNDGGGVARAVVAAMLLYNIGVAAVLAWAGAAQGFDGLLLWPAVLLHAALAVWCIACLRRG